MTVWVVRGLAWYPRKPWNPADEDDMVTVPRPNVYSRCSDAEKAYARGLGCIGIPVDAESKDEAIEIAERTNMFEEIDGPVTRISYANR